MPLIWHGDHGEWQKGLAVWFWDNKLRHRSFAYPDNRPVPLHIRTVGSTLGRRCVDWCAEWLFTCMQNNAHTLLWCPLVQCQVAQILIAPLNLLNWIIVEAQNIHVLIFHSCANGQMNCSWELIHKHARFPFTLHALPWSLLPHSSLPSFYFYSMRSETWEAHTSPSHGSDSVTAKTAHKIHITAVVLYKCILVWAYFSTDALSPGLQYPLCPAPSALSKFGSAHSGDSSACALSVV